MSDVEAVEALLELGLTEYEARCFVALTQLSQGTAKEVSQVADVPQSRVYDVVERLHQLGLVDIQESEPKEYLAAPVELARDRLEQEYSAHLERATTRLEELESRERDEDGTWAIADRQDVLNRTRTHVEGADEELYLLVADEALLDADSLELLAAAADRDVSLFVEVPSSSARKRLHEAVPTAHVVVSDLPFASLPTDERRPGRLLMADREAVLLSARREGLVPSETAETGLWARDADHGLVVWLQQLLEDRMCRLEFETAD